MSARKHYMTVEELCYYAARAKEYNVRDFSTSVIERKSDKAVYKCEFESPSLRSRKVRRKSSSK